MLISFSLFRKEMKTDRKDHFGLKVCICVIQSVLSIDNAVVAREADYAQLTFIIDRDVLYEICTFGLMADDKKVRSSANL